VRRHLRDVGPSSRMRPAVGSSNPAISRSVVVLPHPDGPSSEKNSPPTTGRYCPRRRARRLHDRIAWRAPQVRCLLP
jgi:hypothetical protein